MKQQSPRSCALIASEFYSYNKKTLGFLTLMLTTFFPCWLIKHHFDSAIGFPKDDNSFTKDAIDTLTPIIPMLLISMLVICLYERCNHGNDEQSIETDSKKISDQVNRLGEHDEPNEVLISTVATTLESGEGIQASQSIALRKQGIYPSNCFFAILLYPATVFASLVGGLLYTATREDTTMTVDLAESFATAAFSTSFTSLFMFCFSRQFTQTINCLDRALASCANASLFTRNRQASFVDPDADSGSQHLDQPVYEVLTS